MVHRRRDILQLGHPAGGADVIIEHEDNLELSVQSCLKGLGISLLSELDVFAFVYRHPVTLASPDQIASFVGHEVVAVDSALKQLEREKLMERSRPSLGVCLFRFLAPTEVVRKRCLRQLTSLLDSRAGRVLAANQLKLERKESPCEEGLQKSEE